MNSLESTVSRIEMLYNSATLRELCYSADGTELMKIYNSLTGNNYCNVCANTMYPILLDFKKNYTYLIENEMLKILKKYRFKEGETFSFFGEGTVYSNQNLTDGIATLILDAHPDNERLFEVIAFEVPAEETPAKEEVAIERAFIDAEIEKIAKEESKAKAKK